MACLSLSGRDINVLEKIKDPESNPLATLQLDSTLPRDPHITDPSVYERVIQKEREVVLSMQHLELQLAGLRPKTAESPVEDYSKCVTRLDSLISEHPNYASARNNRAQALRRLYGDAMLVADNAGAAPALISHPSPAEKHRAAAIALSDLETSIALLSPPSPLQPLSTQAAKTLSLAHTQRAAIYHLTAKLLPNTSLDIDDSRTESKWSKLDFEEAASRDFAMGGRYGNEIAKGLAVSTNPTAKLCGEMVREAMKKEYGPAFGS